MSSLVKFICHFNNKKSYNDIKAEVFKARATIIREKVRDLRDEFGGEIEIATTGGFLYRLIKQNGYCTNIFLLAGDENS